MKLIIDGVVKEIHYSIAMKLVKDGKACLLEGEIFPEKKPIEEKKIVKRPGRKKIVKDNGNNK